MSFHSHHYGHLWHLWLGQHLVSIAVFLMTLVFVSHVVRERRAPGGMIAWLLLILLAPQIGLPLYLFFGWSRIRQNRHARGLYSPIEFETTPESRGTVERLLLAAGAPPRRVGNTVALHADGVEAFKLLLGLIENARSEIHIATFILGNDEVGNEIIGRLEKKAREGVRVRFLLDGYGAVFTARAAIKKLVAAGGRFATFLPMIHLPFRGHTNLRNHRKIVVIDGAHAIVGGMNLAREYMGPEYSPARWADLALHVQGPAVADLDEIFRSNWAFATGERLEAGLRPAAPGSDSGDSGSPLQVVASGPDVPTALIYDCLLTAVFEARARVWIATPYFIPDETLTRALVLACRRGIDVRVLVPARSNHLLADVGRGSYLRQIEDEGARILLHPKMVHAKAMIVDDGAIVGSANADMRSFFFNYEVCAFLSDGADVQTVSRWFEMMADACRIGYPRPKFGSQTLEGVTRILSPLL